MKGIVTSHPSPADEQHEPKAWVLPGARAPYPIETVTRMGTRGQRPALSDHVSDFLSVDFFGKKLFGQSRKVCISHFSIGTFAWTLFMDSSCYARQ